MNDMSLAMKKIEGLQKFFYGSLHKPLIEATILPENKFHVPQAHLGRLQDQDHVSTMRPANFKRI